MRFSEQWLREWVDPAVNAEQLAEQLTMAGLEVDSVELAAPAFEGVVVGRVVELAPHPDADKLRVAKVDVAGDDLLQIVCGAPNVAVDMLVPTAVVGAKLPGDFKIKKAKLRGVQSFGMLCSARELGLSEDHSGLMALPADAPVGSDVRDYLQLDDQLIDVDLTPNRGDCLGMAGIAREVGVLNRCDLHAPVIDPVAAACDDAFPVSVTAADACPRYLGRVIRGINPQAETPMWMQEKLRRGGIRSLGPVVDVTNYVMLELGQPMHAFDRNELQGGIEVRWSKADEKLTLLDGREVALDAGTLVIADAARPLALAGVMGGEHSGISDDTRDLFLECAFFSPLAIAGRARRYGLQTDSSYRFERGVDPDLAYRAMERATALLLELVGGEAGPVTDVSSAADLPARTPIGLRRSQIARLLGVELADTEVREILERLDMQVQNADDGWQVSAPGFRFDIAIEADLIEELGRIHGYNQLPDAPPRGDLRMRPCPEEQVPAGRVADRLVDLGYQEAICYSFVDPDLQRMFANDLEPVALANPISSEMSVMRTSLWPGLIKALQHNLHRQQNRVRLFETGLTFVPGGDAIVQRAYVGGVVCGDRLPEQWGMQPPQPVDFFDAKGDVEALLDFAGIDGVNFEAAQHPALHPGKCARIVRGETHIGWLGNLHPDYANKLDVPENTYLFELDSEEIERRGTPSFEPLSRFPSIRRDLSLLVRNDCAVAKIRACIETAAGGLLRELRVFDVYSGKGIESGLKSIALGLILQDSSRTLTDEDVDRTMTGVTSALEKELGATLRE